MNAPLQKAGARRGAIQLGICQEAIRGAAATRSITDSPKISVAIGNHRILTFDTAAVTTYAATEAARNAANSFENASLANVAAGVVAAAAATLSDVKRLKSFKPSLLGRAFGKTIPDEELGASLEAPLWPEVPREFLALWRQLQSDLLSLDAGFEIWIDWYQDRLDGKPFNWELERQWALLSKEQLAQSPAEINAYLKALRDGALTKQFKRVRAIFIGHGEVGKTSLIRALHGEEVIAGQEAMTQGVAIQDAIHEQAGVFTRVTDYKDDDLTVHFWDFGGQVMAHATHQFFLRSKCLYVIVLAGRSERNPNEEAEYWLEHVRAFGDSAPGRRRRALTGRGSRLFARSSRRGSQRLANRPNASRQRNSRC